MNGKKMALCGLMCALAVVIMALGGLIPLATFCCPALAGLTLIPIFFETKKKYALCAYAVIAILGMLFCPDKEAALLFLFLGWYPVMKLDFDKLTNKPLRVLCKLGAFDLAAGAMLLSLVYLFNMQSVINEYAEMGKVMLVVYVVLANVTMLLYDRLLMVMMILYLKKWRKRILKG